MPNLPNSGASGNLDNQNVSRDNFRTQMTQLLQFMGKQFGNVSGYTTQAVPDNKIILQNPEVADAAWPVATASGKEVPNCAWVRNLSGGPSENYIINGAFTVNSRGHANPGSVTNGTYGYDRWKQLSASEVEQTVPDLLVGASYTLSWTGGGNGWLGTVNGPSPLTATCPANGRLVVRIPRPAGSAVNLVYGTVARPFVPRPQDLEEYLCGGFCTAWNSESSSAPFDRNAWRNGLPAILRRDYDIPGTFECWISLKTHLQIRSNPLVFGIINPDNSPELRLLFQYNVPRAANICVSENITFDVQQADFFAGKSMQALRLRVNYGTLQYSRGTAIFAQASDAYGLCGYAINAKNGRLWVQAEY